MSAIHEGPRLIGPFRKQHTKVKAIIHSHNRPEPYDVTDDVFNCTTGKNIKGVGQANLACLPRINYLNHISPNDYVNIYFDKCDGHGWVRTFFGLVDRVEEGFEVTEEGPKTVYYIICSDFTKIFDKTEYYTNPRWHTEDSFLNSSVGAMLPRLSIRSQGLLVQGGPSELVTQIIFALLGFSQQFKLPESYVSAIQNTSLVDENRRLRIQTAEAVMTEEQRNALGDTGAQGLLDRAAKTTANQAYGLESPPSAENDRAALTAQVADLLGVDIDQVDSMRAQNPENFSRLLAEENVSRELYSLPGSDAEQAVGTRTGSVATILRGASPASSPTALDLINVGSFVERETIDGFTYNSAIPNYHGSIINLLRQHSNDIVNELFFDLRPVSDSGDGLAEGCQWSTDPDELAGNIDTSHGNRGVKYVPAVIMRENPFSTIQEVDATNVSIGLRGPNNELLQYNLFPIGAIFSNKPNLPGRHIISFPNINAVDKMNGRSTAGKRHLDVAVISTDDIVKTSFGRSDTDHFNITALVSQSFMGQSAQQYMKDLSPIVTPLHVQRHGLRVRILSTRFDRLHDASNQGQTPTAQPNQPPPTQEEAVQAPPEDAGIRTTVWHPPAIVTEKHPIGRIPPVINQRKSAGTRWGYVRFENNTNNTQKRMHNGVDIYGAVGTPITAIADGIVVKKFVNGQQDIYGNMLVIQHPGMGDNGEDVYSLYAHMGRPKTIGAGTTPNPNWRAGENASEAFAINPSTNARLAEGDRVTAGQVIGYMGWTAGRRSEVDHPGQQNCGLYRRGLTRYRPPGGGAAQRLAPNGVHLHFEITRVMNGGFYPSNAFNRTLQRVPASVVSSQTPPFHSDTSVADRLCSIDPVAFLQRKGVDILADGVMDQTGTVSVDDPEEENLIEPEQDSVPLQETVTNDAGVENQATADSTRANNATQTSGTSVDSPATRNLLARWVILQDHWYQHNLEYLSGDITLSRGAPEIRVGYRLDITDRNLSFYVESVSHSWQHPGALKTTLKVTRGQPNNPFPAYILPRNSGFGSGENQRFEGSRLGKYFVVPDPIALKRAKVFRQGYDGVRAISSPDTNKLDTEQELLNGSEKYILPSEFTLDTEEDVVLPEDEVTAEPAVGSLERAQMLNIEFLNEQFASAGQLPLDGTNTNELFTGAP